MEHVPRQYLIALGLPEPAGAAWIPHAPDRNMTDGVAPTRIPPS